MHHGSNIILQISYIFSFFLLDSVNYPLCNKQVIPLE